MSHPFGDLLSRYLHRKHALSQAKLADGVLLDPSVIAKMCKGQRLTGSRARQRVLAIIGWLHEQGAIETQAEADGLLAAAGLAALQDSQPVEQALLRLLPSPAPPARAVPSAPQAARHHNLPRALTPFIGREPELVRLGELLTDPGCRLITLVGSGGIGKTRLALQAAAQQLDAFQHGAAFVALAQLSAPDFVAPAIADALGLALSGRGDALAELLGYLRPRELLLILDNCEHLLAGANLLAEILQGAPGVTLLATSRERLGLNGEWLFAVEGLPVAKQWNAAESEGAAALFLQTARRLRAGFAPAGAEQAAVVRICQLVEGMPLALILAAAWVRVLSCAEIAAEIERSLDILAVSSRDLPARQQSMLAVFDHSWQLLSPEEQRMFMWLSVFRSGFTPDAAQLIADAGLPLLLGLVDKSLVSAHINGRCELHELARQYAADKLQSAHQAEAASQRHLAYFLDLAERAAPEMTGPRQSAWLDQLEAEHNNLRAALAWAHSTGQAEQALRLAGGLWRFWFLRGHLTEGERWLRRSLVPAGPPSLKARALLGASFIAEFRGQYEQAAVWAAESLALARAAADQSLAALSLSLLGEANAHIQGDAETRELLMAGLAAARGSGDAWLVAFALAQLAQFTQPDPSLPSSLALAEESAALARATGDRWLLALSLFRLGSAATQRQDFAMAYAVHEESLAIRRELGDRLGMAYALLGLANAAYAQGNIQEALERTRERLALERELNNSEGVTNVLNVMGWMHFALDDTTGAVACFEEGLAVSRAANWTWGAASLLDNLGQVALAYSQLDRARAYLTESLALYQELQQRVESAIAKIPSHNRQLARVLMCVGQIDYLQGRLPEARARFESALQIFRDRSDKAGIGGAAPWLGCVAYRAGDLQEARAMIECGLANIDPAEHWPQFAFALLSLGDVDRLQADAAHAAELYGRSLQLVLAHEVRPDKARGLAGLRPDLAQYLEAFAKLALLASQPERAARLFGAAQALREKYGPAIPPVELAEYDRSVAQLRQQLHPAALNAAWAEGLTLSWEQAAAYALEDAASAGRSGKRQQSKTNQQISLRSR